MKLISFLTRRASYGFFMLLSVIILGFFLLHLSPGDIVDTLAGEMGGITQEMRTELRHHYGLDQPLPVQLFTYIKNVFRGDLGYSFYLKQPVLKLVLDRFPATALLFVFALILSTVIGTVMGSLASLKSGGFFSATVTVLSLAGYSAPAFWIGILLLLAFAVYIPLFPVSGMISIKLATEGGSLWAQAANTVRHLVLPLTTLSVIYVAEYSRLARASMIEVLRTDYIRTARVKGLPEHVVIFKHALRNAVLPIITVVGLRLGHLFSGAVVVETVFGWPGLGQLAFRSVLRRDYPVVLGVLFFASLMVIISNILTDLAYKAVDPRMESI